VSSNQCRRRCAQWSRSHNSGADIFLNTAFSTSHSICKKKRLDLFLYSKKGNVIRLRQPYSPKGTNVNFVEKNQVEKFKIFVSNLRTGVWRWNTFLWTALLPLLWHLLEIANSLHQKNTLERAISVKFDSNPDGKLQLKFGWLSCRARYQGKIIF